jgi:hypothetical protein
VLPAAMQHTDELQTVAGMGCVHESCCSVTGAQALKLHVDAALTANWTGDPEAAWAAALADAGGQTVGSVLHRRGIPTRLAEASF